MLSLIAELFDCRFDEPFVALVSPVNAANGFATAVFVLADGKFEASFEGWFHENVNGLVPALEVVSPDAGLLIDRLVQ